MLIKWLFYFDLSCWNVDQRASLLRSELLKYRSKGFSTSIWTVEISIKGLFYFDLDCWNIDQRASLLSPLTPKMCGLSISNVNLFKRELESVQHSHTPFHASCSLQNFVCFSPYNWLSNWASLLGLSNWALVFGLEWDQQGPIRH